MVNLMMTFVKNNLKKVDEAEDRREDDRIDHDKNNHRSDRNQSQNHSQRNDRDETGYEQSPNIEHPTDSNHRES